ncbi:hypothetical protein AB1Y20_002687 [Prymnesium parvum]|uniref:Uncharacterized protein n=1 Tax=Prymnesium parvum TaxID=97485 RepID=A0AB34JCA2_PRYPA
MVKRLHSARRHVAATTSKLRACWRALLEAWRRAAVPVISFLRISFYAKLFFSVVLLETGAAFVYSCALVLNADTRGDENCNDPSTEQCFHPRNARAVALPLLSFTVGQFLLLINAIANENSVQLSIAVLMHTIAFGTLFYENVVLLSKCSASVEEMQECEWRHKGLNSLLYGVVGGWPPAYEGLIATNITIVALTAVLWYAAARVHSEFGWRSFRTVGNDPAARRMLRTFYLIQTTLRLEFAALVGLLISGNIIELSVPRSPIEWNAVFIIAGGAWMLAMCLALKWRMSRTVIRGCHALGLIMPIYIVFKFIDTYRGVPQRGEWMWFAWARGLYFALLVSRITSLCLIAAISWRDGLDAETSPLFGPQGHKFVEHKPPSQVAEALDSADAISAITVAMKGSFMRARTAAARVERLMFMQLTADCTMLRWSWTQYLLVFEISEVDVCGAVLGTVYTPFEQKTDSEEVWPSEQDSEPSPTECHLTKGMRAKSSGVLRAPKLDNLDHEMLLEDIRQLTSALTPEELDRSFYIRYGGRGRLSIGKEEPQNGGLMLLTCDDVHTACAWSDALRALMVAMPQMLHKSSAIQAEQLDMLRHAFKASDDGQGFVTLQEKSIQLCCP